MHVVNVSFLRNNPSRTLRCARDDLVVVMRRDQPDAVMIGLQSGKLLAEPGVRAALATALFRAGGLSLARAARMAQMPLASFIAHVSRLGISVVDHDESEVPRDLQTLDEWLTSSCAVPAPSSLGQG
ncbi:prevent-host-death protein [Pseudorhodoferax sp. Leaf267]|nr:prevent-host-death protein [Pseudorhodoferax sp. Leaf267]